MSRNQSISRPVQNMFALSRLRKDCYYQPIRVDFSPIQRPSHQIQQIIPHFNNDGQYFTSAFILPRERITMEQELKLERSKFECRRGYYERHMQDKTPEQKPTDNNYCQLCQQQFLCYWQHINAKYHKRMINASKFNRDIMVLCETMSRANAGNCGGKSKHIEKKKTITTTKCNPKVKNQQRGQILKQQAMAKESLITMGDSQKLGNSCPMDISPEQQKKLEESLKITLQLGNHSTNLLSSNTFKDIFKNNT